MLEASKHRPAVSRRTRVHADDIRRSVARQSTNWRESLGDGAMARNILVLVAVYPFLTLIPGLVLPASLYFLLAPVAALYFLWFAGLKRRLPFRVPWDWHGPDYSTPKPGRPNEYADADGLLYLGRDQETMTELHITNSDARRHMFCLGTTGSGKALPVRALVLTPDGFRRIGDLVEGDLILRSNGKIGRIAGVYPQGLRALVRLTFQDGRISDCDRDHLWKVRIDGDVTSADAAGWRVMTAADLGVFTGVYPERATRVPLVARPDAGAFAFKGDFFTLGAHPDWTQARPRGGCAPDQYSLIEIEARAAQRAVWAAGGVCLLVFDADGRAWLRYRLPLDRAAADCDLGIVSVEPLDQEEDCVCIKIEDDPDAPEHNGLFVTDNYVVTHNTEVLLGICAQPLMWSSGFLFVDGKGTPPFYARVFSLCKRFGRQDDLRVINFMGAEGSDAPSGGPSSQTNTMNPFARGTADQLTNMLISLMGDSGSSGDMWKGRAAQLISSAMSVLVELRDSGDLLLDVQAIRDFLPLGKGVWGRQAQPPARPGMARPGAPGAPASGMEGVTDAEWEAMKEKPGMIELYLRSLRGEFSTRSALALKGFFDSLPGFILDKAWSGQEQDGKTLEQYGYLSMQLTKPLGSLADDFGHIFRTPLGEVDMNDVVFQRRILVVLLPALQKAPDEIKNCGKIIIAMLKAMMGLASGDKIDGSRLQIIESSATKSSTPFVVVADEIGYYMVDGVDVMMAQARSLNFCVIPAGQDLQAMKKGGSTVADSVSANARLTIIGATEDAKETRQFVMDKIGRGHVAATSSYQSQSGMMGSQYTDQMSVSFQETELVTLQELQGLQAGEFYMLFEGVVARCSTFYIGEDFAARSRVNKFLKVRSPADRAPGLDQRKEIQFNADWETIFNRLNASAEHDLDHVDPTGGGGRQKNGGNDQELTVATPATAHGLEPEDMALFENYIGVAPALLDQDANPWGGADHLEDSANAWRAQADADHRWAALAGALAAAAFTPSHETQDDSADSHADDDPMAEIMADEQAETERLGGMRSAILGVRAPAMVVEDEEDEGDSGGPSPRPSASEIGEGGIPAREAAAARQAAAAGRRSPVETTQRVALATPASPVLDDSVVAAATAAMQPDIATQIDIATQPVAPSPAGAKTNADVSTSIFAEAMSPTPIEENAFAVALRRPQALAPATIREPLREAEAPLRETDAMADPTPSETSDETKRMTQEMADPDRPGDSSWVSPLAFPDVLTPEAPAPAQSPKKRWADQADSARPIGRGAATRTTEQTRLSDMKQVQDLLEQLVAESLTQEGRSGSGHPAARMFYRPSRRQNVLSRHDRLVLNEELQRNLSAPDEAG